MRDDDERDEAGGGPGHGGDERTVMPDASGGTRSIWMRTEVPELDGPVPAGLEVDVCIVGAGMAGLSVAYHLSKAGQRVAVVDDGPIGGGETGRTTAHLASALDDRFYRLEHVHGKDGARLAAAAHAAAIDDIERNVAELRLDCDFRRVDGYLFGAAGGDADELARELEAAARAGLAPERLERAPFTSFDTGPCLRFPRQAQFHPLRYLAGLARAIVARGGRIVTGAHATGVEAGEVKVVTGGNEHVIRAPSVVVATNPPINNLVTMPLRQAAYRSYVIAARIARGAVPAGLYWDTADPYHYIRTAPGDGGEELLIVGGEDHRVGQDATPEDRWDKLEAWARERFPITALVTRWSGQIMEPADGLAYIGRTEGKGEDGGVYVVTGDSGNGLTHGALAGLMLTDLITGRTSPYAKVFDPTRSSLRAAGTLLREGLSSTVPYSDWLKPGDVKSAKEIAPGKGAVVRQGLHLLAVYRDASGHCHAHSAACPHLGGVVQWNGAESSWDCPCHGSRFDAHGKVIAGPANSDLEPAKLDED
jgi:glycine/D-amino acid oxidase-like deaminating enzyme/nitrite reductase/ring-hydroxylating ferredoxin subunit